MVTIENPTYVLKVDSGVRDVHQKVVAFHLKRHGVTNSISAYLYLYNLECLQLLQLKLFCMCQQFCHAKRYKMRCHTQPILLFQMGIPIL